jgi:hypothetical protein
MEFTLQSIWTTTGAAAAVLVIGYVFGFLQSVAPFIPSTGTLRNVVLTAITGALVVLAALDSGKTVDDPDFIANVIGGIIVFLGLQRMAIAASDAGTVSAVKSAGGEVLEVKPPANVPTEGG